MADLNTLIKLSEDQKKILHYYLKVAHLRQKSSQFIIPFHIQEYISLNTFLYRKTQNIENTDIIKDKNIK